ncbi:MAG: alpha/beta hydrolase [Gemmatimonadales bacterium]
MTTTLERAVTTATLFADLGDRRIAYRSLGEGPPLLLCNRFRGTLDTWDPAFLDALATRFRVITFDLSGIGRSTGEVPTDGVTAAADVAALARFLGLDRVVLAGWSLGGYVAQVAATRHPGLVSHLVLLGTAPPGVNPHPMEPVFLATALKPVNDLDDEVILFFEPASDASRAAVRGATSGSRPGPPISTHP